MLGFACPQARCLVKAVLLTGHGGAEKLVYREDLPFPEPTEGEVLVEVAAAGVNNTDLWTRQGAYGRADDPQATGGWRRGEPMRFPRIQGADIAGRIAGVGSGVPDSRVGERVLLDPIIRSAQDEEGLVDAGLLGSERDGGFAEYVSVPAHNAVAVDSPMMDEELATFPTAYLTALRMLNRARLGAGETVLVTGASGGVGSALVQLAGLRGAHVVALTGAGKEQWVRELGARAVITRGVSDIAAAVRRAVGARAVDVVADVAGGDDFPGLLEVLRPLGRYVASGAIAGPLVSLDLRTLYLGHLEIIGTSIGTREEFVELVGYIERGELKPLLAGVYPLPEIKQAQKEFEQKRFFGKLVVVPR